MTQLSQPYNSPKALSLASDNLRGQPFTRYCGLDTNGRSLMSAYVPNFELCVDLCQNLNDYQAGSGTQCTSANYLPAGTPPGNCWAKTGTQLIATAGNDAALLTEMRSTG